MATDIHFFATKSDLLPIFGLVDGGLQYVRTGHYSNSEPQIFFCGSDIPNLGTARYESAVACDNFLICDKGRDVIARKLSPLGGVERFALDQLVESAHHCLHPGGVW